MPLKYMAPALLLVMLLAGCNKTKITCTDEEGQKVVKEIISEQAEKTIKGYKHQDGNPVFDAAKIRATLSQIQISIENIRTAKTDPNSTKVFCEGTLKFTVPTELLTEAGKAREMAKSNTLSQEAQRLGFDNSADTFTKSIAYSVQPTDDGKKVYAELENATTTASLLTEIVASGLLKPVIEDRAKAAEKVKAEQAAEQARAQAEEDQQKSEQKKAALGLARSNNALANQQINTIWKNLPDFTQKTLLAQQRAWIKKKDIDCKVESAGKSTDPDEKEMHRLNCDTQITSNRAAQLQQYLSKP